MKAFRDPTFSDRLGNSSAAKKAALDRFRAKAEDPAVAELRAARAAAAAERELRAAERAEARRVEQERQAAQKAADEIAARAEREARQIREADEMLVLEAQRKAERDARYAARKARKAAELPILMQRGRAIFRAAFFASMARQSRSCREGGVTSRSARHRCSTMSLIFMGSSRQLAPDVNSSNVVRVSLRGILACSGSCSIMASSSAREL